MVAQGTPEDIVAAEGSHTGRFLREVLARRPVVRAGEGDVTAKPKRKPKAVPRERREAAE